MNEAGPPGSLWRLRVFEELASTSDYVIERARAGEPDHLAVVARRQTAGRGSAGRSWLAGDGNLALSVLLRPASPLATAGQWSLLAGLATIEALASSVRNPEPLQLKWPNDILLDGAKLAGILVESAARDDRIDWLVVGIGANILTAPALPGRSTACLAQLGLTGEPDSPAHAALDRLHYWRQRQSRDGFDPIRAAWLARAHPIGTPLRIRAAGQQRSGHFAGLAPSGALRLATDSGIQTIMTADISLAACGSGVSSML